MTNNAILGIDLAHGEDETVITRELNIKHSCGHTATKKISGYSRYAETHGNPEKQIREKAAYFTGQSCCDCRYPK